MEALVEVSLRPRRGARGGLGLATAGAVLIGYSLLLTPTWPGLLGGAVLAGFGALASILAWSGERAARTVSASIERLVIGYTRGGGFVELAARRSGLGYRVWIGRGCGYYFSQPDKLLRYHAPMAGIGGEIAAEELGAGVLGEGERAVVEVPLTGGFRQAAGRLEGGGRASIAEGALLVVEAYAGPSLVYIVAPAPPLAPLRPSRGDVFYVDPLGASLSMENSCAKYLAGTGGVGNPFQLVALEARMLCGAHVPVSLECRGVRARRA